MTGRHHGSLGNKHRNAYALMTASNAKTIKGEKAGYLSAILYLSPAETGGGPTLCPHSTPACREMCLAAAGLSGLPRQLEAKRRRTHMFNERRDDFIALLRDDLRRLQRLANDEGMHPVARLNGSSDVMWERVAPSLYADFWRVQFVEYTKIPLHYRRVPRNVHLTYSYMGPDDAERAVGYLTAGHSVAAVVPEDVKAKRLPEPGSRYPYGEFFCNGQRFPIVDGDAHDLRFLDPPGSLVLLKPKGHKRTELVRPNVIGELLAAAKVMA